MELLFGYTCIIKKYITIREEATLTLASFHAGPLSGSNWNLEMLVFVKGGKPENLEKTSHNKERTKPYSYHAP